MELSSTPIEIYKIGNRKIHVKREDCCVPHPGPPFSKVRGLLPHMQMLKEKGIKIVGYVESSISMAGWGVAWVAKELGIRCIIYDPQYKETPKLLSLHRKKWKLFDAEIRKIKAGMVRVNYNICRKRFYKEFPDNAHMLQLGIPLQETIDATGVVYRQTIDEMCSKPKYIVINVGSGTIMAGVLRVWKPGDGILIGITGRRDNIRSKFKKIKYKANRQDEGLFSKKAITAKLFDSGYEYTEKAKTKPPFPCHPYYDAKAWEWLCENIKELNGKILFWNIGRMA